MKKILFDLTKTQPIGDTKIHGGGKYGLQVFERIVHVASDKISVYYDDAQYLDANAQKLISKYKLTFYLKREITLYNAARKESGVVYCCLFDSRCEPLPPDDITLIQTQHGLRLLEITNDKYQYYYIKNRSVIRPLIRRIKNMIYPSDVKVRKSLDKLFERSNVKNITVSFHSKASILTFFPKLESKDIKVFYSPSTITESVISTNNIYGKYYLLVSGNRWVKNSIRAIIALDQLFSEHPGLEGKVVITGLNSSEEIRYRINNYNRFCFIGYVDENTLSSLYKNAYLFIYPSLNEGFGYPPLEAMHKGCPVISSAIASIPEVCGDAVLYFNPYSVSEIKMRILQMEDRALRSDFIRKGFKRQHEIEDKQKKDLILLCQYILSFVS